MYFIQEPESESKVESETKVNVADKKLCYKPHNSSNHRIQIFYLFFKYKAAYGPQIWYIS